MAARYDDIYLLDVSIKEAAEERDYNLASLLMRAALYNDDITEKERGLCPLYLIQAYYLNRELKDDLKALL